jgi:hypothetical protein
MLGCWRRNRPIVATAPVWLLAVGIATQAADTIPPNAHKYAPLLVQEQEQRWKGSPQPNTMAGQVEQETCISLKSSGCWNPHTELKTSREYGFGLGQVTVTKSFNAFNEERALDPSLKNWQWNDRFDPRMQLRGLVLKDFQLYRLVQGAATDEDRLAFSYAAYNGGMGGVLSDRRVCAATKGCDPSRWFGQVEHTSLKARAAVTGYGQSFFQINRGYVQNILRLRSAKYGNFFKGAAGSRSSSSQSLDDPARKPLADDAITSTR